MSFNDFYDGGFAPIEEGFANENFYYLSEANGENFELDDNMYAEEKLVQALPAPVANTPAHAPVEPEHVSTKHVSTKHSSSKHSTKKHLNWFKVLIFIIVVALVFYYLIDNKYIPNVFETVTKPVQNFATETVSSFTNSSSLGTTFLALY